MDYYSILGVNKNASDADLKKAYRKLAMENHPDRTGGDDTKFKKINEAYDTLKDPQRRANYDNPQPNQNAFGQNFGNYDDIFANMFGRRSTRNPNRSVKLIYRLLLSETVTGKREVVNYNLPSGKNKVVDLTIPKGIVHNQTVRYSGLGDRSYKEFPPGDLEITFKVKNDTPFVVDGYNLGLTLPISVFDLILGTEREIKTITGRTLKLKIKQNTSPNSILSISGEGLHQFNSDRRGTLYIDFKTKMPNLNADQLQSLEKINNDLSK